MKPVQKALRAKAQKDKASALKNKKIVEEVNKSIEAQGITVTEACRNHDIAVDKYYRYRKRI